MAMSSGGSKWTGTSEGCRPRRKCLATCGLAILTLLFIFFDSYGDLGLCNARGVVYQPQSSERTAELDWKGCWARCDATEGCGFFNYWPDGGCHLSDQTAVPVDIPGVISGPRGCASLGADEQIESPHSVRNGNELWRIDGAYYDFAPLIKKGHPGGALPLMETRGTDVSVLFKIQHLGSRPQTALKSYLVHTDVVHTERFQELPYSFEPDGFYMVLKDKVRRHLDDTLPGQSPRQCTNAYLAKLGLNALLFTVSWYRVVVYPLSLPMCLLNTVSRLVLTGLAHDAMHRILKPVPLSFQTAYGNFIFRSFLNFNGDKWHYEHVAGHHPHTKTELDPDENLEQNLPIWRLTNATQWKPSHSWPLASHLFLGSFLPIMNALPDIPKMLSYMPETRREAATALSVAILFHLSPFLFQPSWTGVVAVASSSMLASLMTLFTFHVSHLGEHLEVKLKPGMDWGEHQMRTSTNFDTANMLSLSGTLDLQVEHHLFPMLSYENQQSIVPIVKQTAQDFGIPYHIYDSSVSGWYHHLKYMGRIGWF